jgi:hypothetical protein
VITRISKQHVKKWGKRAGFSEEFVLEPRQRDGVYLMKKIGAKGNRDDCYEQVTSLAEAKSLLEAGRSFRMRGQASGEWNTLNGEGTVYA